MLSQFTADELRWTLEGARFGLWSWDIEADQIRWSSQLGKIYGVHAKDYPDNIAALSAMLPASINENLQAQILSSANQGSGRFEFDHPILRPNGILGWVQNTGRIEFDENQRPTRIHAITSDITEQKQAEISLQAREEQFRRFSELTSDYIFEVDMTVETLVPYLVAGSYERVVGYTAEELAEKGGWTSIMNEEDLKAGLEVSKQLQSGVPTVHEYRILNKHGETRWLRDHSYPIMENNNLIKLVGGVKDISETKALQDQLIQAKKHEAMAHLVGAVAHDFNNLLAVVSATAELISLDSHDRAEMISDILLACDRATELTRSLLAFTHTDLPQTRTIRLSDAISKISGLLRRTVGEQIIIRMEYATDINDKVDIDPGHLQLVLLNLATNARAAMSNRGELVISVSAVAPDTDDLPQMSPSQTVLLAITDTGCGIEEQHLEHVFDAFYTTKLRDEGSGIGLATCWQIIERAGGTIQVKSELTQGTTFSIYLPTADTAVYQEVTQNTQFSIGGKERILVVEDDPAVRRATMRILSSFGYDVTGADDVQAAQQAIADDNYDMLVVDVHLPDGNGYNLVRKVRETNHKLPALLVSGYIDDSIRSKIRDDGYSVLPKPFSASALARSVKATLAT